MTEKEKKRKRTSEGGHRPSKKTAKTSDIVKVTHLPADDTGLGPIIASTPGISAPKSINFTAYKKYYIPKTGSDRTKRRQILLQSSEHPRLDFLGQNEPLGAGQADLKHYVGVYDPETGKLTLVEAPRVTIRSSLRPTQEELDEEKQIKEKQTMMAMRNSLGQEFGTKKSKKIIADQTINAISQQRKKGETAPPVDAAQQFITDALDEKTSSIKTAEQRQAQIDQLKPRPIPNVEASQPSDVYPVDNLIDPDVSSALMIPVANWISSAKINQNFKMRFVARRFTKCTTSKNPKLTTTLLKYIDILMNWFLLLLPGPGMAKDGRKLPQRDKIVDALDAPGKVLDHLRKTFSDGAVLSKWHVDKVILHICAIALHIDNFELDMHDLQEDLRLDAAVVAKYFAELGCSVKPMSKNQAESRGIKAAAIPSHKVARLQLPLQFPKAGRSRADPRR